MNKTKTDLFTAMEELSNLIPEMRVGQLLAAIGELCADLHGRDLWDATDVELSGAILQFRQNFQSAVKPQEAK